MFSGFYEQQKDVCGKIMPETTDKAAQKAESRAHDVQQVEIGRELQVLAQILISTSQDYQGLAYVDGALAQLKKRLFDLTGEAFLSQPKAEGKKRRAK